MCGWKSQNFKIQVLRKSPIDFSEFFTERRDVPREVIFEVQLRSLRCEIIRGQKGQISFFDL